jgi:hypothetical protein
VDPSTGVEINREWSTERIRDEEKIDTEIATDIDLTAKKSKSEGGSKTAINNTELDIKTNYRQKSAETEITGEIDNGPQKGIAQRDRNNVSDCRDNGEVRDKDESRSLKA